MFNANSIKLCSGKLFQFRESRWIRPWCINILMIKINCIILTVVFSGVSNILWQLACVCSFICSLFFLSFSLYQLWIRLPWTNWCLYLFIFYFFFVCGEIACHRDGIWVLSSTRTFNLNRNMIYQFKASLNTLFKEP